MRRSLGEVVFIGYVAQAIGLLLCYYMAMKVHQVYKKIGETPLEALEKFRKKSKISPAAKLTYAGRLDPMASGVLLILEGATQADREKYMGLNKEYEVKVLFGFETDSYDLLGMAKRVKGLGLRVENIEEIIEKYHGLIKLPIPPYSSVPYKGKPLFEWARAGKLKEKDLPRREFKVQSIKLKGLKQITSAHLLKYIQTQIKKVKGDFRQEKILKAWEEILKNPSARVIPGNAERPGIQGKKVNPRKLGPGSEAGMTQSTYLISNISISVSSGTYIRSIAHDLGKKLKVGGVVFRLERTKVGKFKNQG